MYYTKTVDSVFCVLWLATQTQDIQCFLTPEWHQTRIRSDSRKLQDKWLSGLLPVANTEISQLNEEAVPNSTKKAKKFTYIGSFYRQIFCLFNLNFHEWNRQKRFLFYKCKLGLALLYSADMFINKLETKSNRVFL